MLNRIMNEARTNKAVHEHWHVTHEEQNVMKNDELYLTPEY